MKVLVKENQNLFDVLINKYGRVDDLFSVLNLNPTLSADTIQVGQQIDTDNSLSLTLQNLTPKDLTYITKNGQNLFDLSLQLYGNLDNFFNLNQNNLNIYLKNFPLKYQNVLVGNETIKKNTIKQNLSYNNYAKLNGDYNNSYNNSFFI